MSIPDFVTSFTISATSEPVSTVGIDRIFLGLFDFVFDFSERVLINNSSSNDTNRSEATFFGAGSTEIP